MKKLLATLLLATLMCTPTLASDYRFPKEWYVNEDTYQYYYPEVEILDTIDEYTIANINKQENPVIVETEVLKELLESKDVSEVDKGNTLEFEPKQYKINYVRDNIELKNKRLGLSLGFFNILKQEGYRYKGQEIFKGIEEVFTYCVKNRLDLRGIRFETGEDLKPLLDKNKNVIVKVGEVEFVEITGYIDNYFIITRPDNYLSEIVPMKEFIETLEIKIGIYV